MSLIPYTPTSECFYMYGYSIYNHYNYVEWLPNIVWTNPIYSIILSYFIGMYAGIFMSIEYVHKYNYVLYGVMDSDSEKDSDEDKETENNETEDNEPEDKETEECLKDDDNDDDQDDDLNDDESDNESKDEDYTEEDLKQDEAHDDKQEEEDENEFTKMEIRDTIDNLYIKTDDWDNFVSTKSIYVRLQKLYPSITKFMVKEAMNVKPRYITGTQHNAKGYRFITPV